MSIRMVQQGMFRIRLGSKLAPGFFTWEIPCGDFARVELCCSLSAGPPAKYLKRFLTDIGAYDCVIGMHSGKIPLGNDCRIVSDRTMLVCDTVCQVKSVSGDGLYLRLTAAALLAETISIALNDYNLLDHRLGAYAKNLYNAFCLVDRGWRFKCMLVRMTDDNLNAAGRFISREGVRGVLDGIDIDHPSMMIRGLLGYPAAFLSAIPLMLRCIF